jgi:hypothetical protein
MSKRSTLATERGDDRPSVQTLDWIQLVAGGQPFGCCGGAGAGDETEFELHPHGWHGAE